MLLFMNLYSNLRGGSGMVEMSGGEPYGMETTTVVNYDGSISVYNSLGKELSLYDSTGFIWKSTYDDRGHELTYENRDGDSYECTYDDKGRLLTFKDNHGYSEEHSYDSTGKISLYKRKDGYWERWVYDIHGNRVTSQDSTGRVAFYIHKDNTLGGAGEAPNPYTSVKLYRASRSKI